MSKNNIELGTGKITCEALGCDSKAKAKLCVKVGAKANITLFLCDRCKSKFSEDRASQLVGAQ
jgi:hypothetical protein